jgi:beta-N-acetylhexosaminidase
VVLRDPVRHPWQRRLLQLPAAVVVDVGWPSDIPVDLPVIRTRGVAPGLLAAAAERLAGRVPAGSNGVLA